MATIVPTSEEDPILSVVRFTAELAWGDAGPEVAEPQVSRLCLEAQDCVVMGRWLDLVSLMFTSADLVASRVSAKDLECIYTVICDLVTRSDSPDDELEIAKFISSKLVQQPSDKASLRLKILFNLYNLLVNPYSRFFVYMKALNLAASAKVTDGVIPTFKKIDSFLKEWNIERVDRRELFLSIATILKDNKTLAKDRFHFLSKYLVTFSEEDGPAMEEAKEEAAWAVVEFIKAPDMFQCDLLDLPAVAQLEKDEKYAAVYRLLRIFLTKRLDAYLNFHSEESDVFNKYDLVHEDCVTKMRLLSLADLGSKASGCVSYSVIRETLRIDEDDVENWVIKAITANILDCKMDQMSRSIVINRCTVRVFGLQQWESLQSKLKTWRSNVADVVRTVQSSKISGDSGYIAQGVVIR